MDDLWEILAVNGHAKPTATLGHIWANTAQDAQYSTGAREHLTILEKYQEYFNLTVEQMKMRFLMKDCST